MTLSRELIERRLRRITRETSLADWRFRVNIRAVGPETLAEISPEWELRRARVDVSYSYADAGIVSLNELLRHELGHCATHDIFLILRGIVPRENADALTECEDLLATRIGQLLPACEEDDDDD